MLLNFKANVNAADLGGETALHVAVKLGDEHFVSFMLSSGRSSQ